MNKSRLCLLAGKSRQQIDRWIIEGCPVVEAAKDKGGEWKFNTAQVFDWLASRLEAGDDTPDLNKERARLAREQADSQALKNAATRMELLPADEVVAGWQSAIGRSRSLLLGIPTASAGTIVLLVRQHEAAEDSERAVRELLMKLIDAALNELANTDLDEDEDEPVAEAA